MIEKFLIGTYTKRASKGLYEVELDTDKKQLQNLQLVAEATNPTYVTLSKKDVIYSVAKEVNGDDVHGGVLVLDGKEVPSRTIETDYDKGTNPAYISVDEGRQLVYTANYHTGVINVYKIASDGTLAKVDSVKHEGQMGPRPEQADGPHPHFADLTPDGRLVVVDLGQDRVYLYDVSDDGKLSAVSYLELEDGFGPRHIRFDAKKGVAYLVGELSSNVAVLDYDATAGQFSVREVHSTIPADWTEHNGCAAIRVSGDGRFVYVSNRGNNTIAVFESDAKGSLKFVERASVEGDFPRDFNLSADESLLVVVNQESDNGTVFERNADTGKLTVVQKDFSVPAAVCIAREAEFLN
ncbi:lactonase family protein [Nicoliella spurrieriana]|uniref:Lactonase family protein n=1 Tax=Nicoliella spurrieriana TaxID=2925830 RepID=A0A976RR10_9LACO|nr:lactonase family protein [Nicoliella spurrieriana]UQS86268.1 lactonase family protein [Nicoliella spurrieriana]